MTRATRHSWQSVRAQIQARILDAHYKPGDKLPRDQDLAEELGCARATVQRAMMDLAERGIVERRRRGGTHVSAAPRRRATLEVPRVQGEIEQQGAQYGYRLLHCRTLPAPTEVRAALGVHATTPMLYVEALHLADQRPWSLEWRWVCLETVPEMLDVDLSQVSANAWLLAHRPYSDCTLSVSAQQADTHHAACLEVAPGTALLMLERSTWIEQAPITHVRTLMRSGYRLHARL